jgi:hypothetical protein
MKWIVTAHRDWWRLDIAQFAVEAPTREEAIEFAKQQLATGPVSWVVGDLVKRDEGFVVTPPEFEASGP